MNKAQTVEIKKLKRVSVLKPSLNISRENAVSLLNVSSLEDCQVEITESYEHEIADKCPKGVKEADPDKRTYTQNKNRDCCADNTATKLSYREMAKITMQSDPIAYQQRRIPHPTTGVSVSIIDPGNVNNCGNDELSTDEDGFIGVERKQNNT